MSIRKTVCFLVLVGFQYGFGQNELREIKGEIRVEAGFEGSVNIVNTATAETVIVNVGESFSLLAKQADRFIFSAINLESVVLHVTKEQWSGAQLMVQMKPKNNQLKEVIINEYPMISAKGLGLVPENQKSYTAAERKLATAGDFKPIMLLGLLGGSMPLDPLINKINGRTKRLKKQIVVEGKENNLKRLDYYFNEQFYTDKLKIPLDYVDGFKYYLIENPIFVSKLKNNDKQILAFLVIELAVNYNKIIASEN